MVGFTSGFANIIKEIFYNNIPQKYQEVFYKIIEESMCNNDELYYTWYKDEGPYGDLIKILKENGFEVEEDYEDCHSIGLIITW